MHWDDVTAFICKSKNIFSAKRHAHFTVSHLCRVNKVRDRLLQIRDMCGVLLLFMVHIMGVQTEEESKLDEKMFDDLIKDVMVCKPLNNFRPLLRNFCVLF